jgi:hypothetical protein
MGPTGSPETSARDYHHTLRNIPRGQISYAWRRKPKSRNFHIRNKFKGGSVHTIADKFGEVIAKGDFCSKIGFALPSY